MKINFDINVACYLVAISIGIYTSILLFVSQKNRLANKILAFLLLAIVGWVFDAFFRATGIYQQKPSWYFLPIYYSFTFGPLLYLYVKAITNQAFVFGAKQWLHFIPVLLQAIFYWVVTFQSYQTKYFIWFNIHQPYTYRIEYDGTWLSLVIYLLLAFSYFKKYQSWVLNNYSNIGKKLLNWLKFSLITLILVCLAWLFEAFLRDFKNTYYQFDISTNLLCVIIFCIAIIGMQQATNEVVFTAEALNTPITTSAEADIEVMNLIEMAMREDKLYLHPELTLLDLAKHLQLPSKTVSYNINAASGKPFNTYVNNFRVEEVKARLNTTDLEKFTLLGIAFESGFNSKTSFNRIFKEFTGSSPSDFIKK